MSFMDILRHDTFSDTTGVIKADEDAPSIKELIFNKLQSNRRINKKTARTWLKEKLNLDLPTVRQEINNAIVATGKPRLMINFTDKEWEHFKERKKHGSGDSWSKTVQSGTQRGRKTPYRKGGLPIPKITDESLQEEALVELRNPDNDELYCEIPEGSIVVDPWRKFTSDTLEVIHYGKTR